MRRRHQIGSIDFNPNTGVYSLRYLQDVRLADNSVKRRNMRVYLGNKSEGMTEKLARRAADPIMSEVNGAPQAKSVITLNQFLEKWKPMAQPRYRGTTWRNLEGVLKEIVPAFGHWRLAEIDAEQVERFLGQVTRSRVHIFVTAFRAIAKDAKRWKYLVKNPFLDLEIPAYRSSEPKFFTEGQLVRILNSAPEPDKTLYWLLAQTGLRISEALGMTWENVDLTVGHVTVRNVVIKGRVEYNSTKSAAGRRVIPISLKLSEHLRKYRAAWTPNKLDLVFANSKGKPWHDNCINVRHLHPLLDSLQIPRAGFHAFRHASATLLDQMQISMKVRQTRMGHSNPSITLGRYTHVVDQEARDAANHFDRILSPTDNNSLTSPESYGTIVRLATTLEKEQAYAHGTQELSEGVAQP